MATEIKVPTLGESVTEATVAKWFKAVGETVRMNEPLLELETDKVTLEVPAPTGGTLESIVIDAGTDVEVGALLGVIAEGAVASPSQPKVPCAPAPQTGTRRPDPIPVARPCEPAAIPAAAAPATVALSPAVRKLVAEHDLNPEAIPASGKDGRLTKGDVLSYIDKRPAPAAANAPAEPQAAPPQNAAPSAAMPKAEPIPEAQSKEAAAPAAEASPPWQAPPSAMFPPRPDGPREERVRMTRLRKRIAERLKESQNTAATLTTYNECDMSAVMELRNRYKDAFEKKHGVRLGFMSFFVKACVTALREFPVVNASIDGEDIIYKNHYDIGVAVGIEEGLVVPVVRDADALGFAGIEAAIGDLAKRARAGKLALEELQGGTFTISNAGIYGSLNSMPILNPPQAAILGMHKIQKRPVVMPDDSIVARPMMYLALSYDHRLIDGKQAVSFLVRVKECIENPDRIMLDA